MALLKPFRGLRPSKTRVAEVAAPPYDVINSAEARALAAGKPDSFLHVSRPEIDLPEGTDEHADAVYSRGKKNLVDFIDRGVLVKDTEDRFYVYRQKMGSHVQTGFVAAASVEEYDKGLIKKHELTRADKEDDRTRHIDELNANDEPVFFAYRGNVEIDSLIGKVTATKPEYDFVTDDKIGHTFWLVPTELNSALQAAFGRVDCMYIADGHHRSAAASRVHARRKGQPGNHGGFLAVIFPAHQLQILDYNRVVKTLNGLSPEIFLARVGGKFIVTPAHEKRPALLHTFGMYLNKKWYHLEAKPGSFPETPTGSLDVSILQDNLLAPILGIGDPRKDPKIDFIGGIRGVEALEERVNSGKAAVAFSMFPTTLDQLMAIADAGEIMPPKSTWFEPKLRSGLVIHPFT